MDLKNKVAQLTQRPKFGPMPTDNDGILDEQARTPAPEARHEAVQPPKRAGEPGTVRVPKGSQRVPMRESSADRIDGRAARATQRNSRLTLNIREKEHVVFTEQCYAEEISYCETIEEMIRARWPERFK